MEGMQTIKLYFRVTPSNMRKLCKLLDLGRRLYGLGC